MQLVFPRLPSFAQAALLGWRLSALILMAALSSASQGCGIISDTPSRPTPARAVLAPEPRTANPPAHQPQTHISPGEIPPIPTIPPSPETDEAPPLAKIPAPSQPSQVETGLASWMGEDFTVSSPRAEKFLTRRNSRPLIERSPGVAGSRSPISPMENRLKCGLMIVGRLVKVALSMCLGLRQGSWAWWDRE